MPFLSAILRRRPRGTLRLTALALAVVGAWLAGLVWFAANVPREVSAPEARTDAIVVVTGGSGRVREGLALLRGDLAAELLVSGVYRGVDLKELLRVREEDPGDLGKRITLGYDADNTRGNAGETARWMAARNYRSLRLVTSSYHMQRTLLEFRQLMPKVQIVPHPVFAPNVRQDDWWRWPGTANLLISEYMKYLAALVRIAFTEAPAARQAAPAGADG